MYIPSLFYKPPEHVEAKKELFAGKIRYPALPHSSEWREKCHLWFGDVSSSGRAKICVEGKWVRAHNYLYEIYVGKVPHVAYACCEREKKCVNWNHMILKSGRHKKVGVSLEDIWEMFRFLRRGEVTEDEIMGHLEINPEQLQTLLQEGRELRMIGT